MHVMASNDQNSLMQICWLREHPQILPGDSDLPDKIVFATDQAAAIVFLLNYGII